MKNKNKNQIIIVCTTLLVGIMLGWLFFGTSSSPESTKEEHAHSEGANAEASVWTCSMHPQIRQGEPGDCPICGMDLIPLETGSQEVDPMSISMSPTAMQLAKVETMIVGNKQANKTLRLNGKVQTDERSVFTQPSHLPGRIEKLLVNFTGDYVKAGQTIAYVYSPDLVTAQEELFEARKIKEVQPQLFEAAKKKLRNWKLTDAQIEKVLSTNKAIEQFPILSNASGFVTKKLVNAGDYVRQGEPLYEIADLSRLWILFDVYESDMQWVKKGSAVSYTVESVPGKTYRGTIKYIDPIIDPATRVAKARVEVINGGAKLKPEMFVSGRLESKLSTKKESIVVPKTAVMWTGKRSVVYIMNNSSQGVSFAMRKVTLGPELGDNYVIEEGLEAGEEVAVNGTFSIDAAAQLAGKPSMMSPEGGAVMTGHNHGSSSSEPSKSSPSTNSQVSVSKDAKQSLIPLLNTYLVLKNALVADDLSKAKSAASKLNTDLKKISMSVFKGNSHQTWMTISSSLSKQLQHVEHVKNIEELRVVFQGVSTNLISLTESFKPNESLLYVQFCPMVDDNKGAYWLSKDKKVLNPYYGQAMLTCGETKRTIK
ncbi:MAG: efflux RND transporter periplasmic adaptor subunit [Cytophagales bacterium]|nr:efflux RND transporter periplasmic adaptor subunit [Cytophagales bacterium]